MVTESTTTGLVVSTSADRTAALNDLIACCGWPVLLRANAARLHRELEMRNWGCLLFWLEEQEQMAPTVKLVTWLRERDPKPYRVVLAYRLNDGVEAVLRAAGVHGYLSASGELAAVVDEVLGPLLACAGSGAKAAVTSSVGPSTRSELARPP